MAVSPERLSKLVVLAALAAMLLPAAAAAQGDEVVFSSYVEPNVLLVLDNSDSMKEIVWHPDFDPAGVYSCTAFPPDGRFLITYAVLPGPDLILGTADDIEIKSQTITVCGITRELFADPKLGLPSSTIYLGSYLNWLLSRVGPIACNSEVLRSET